MRGHYPVRYTHITDTVHWGSWWAPSDLYFADIVGPGGKFDTWDADRDGRYAEGMGALGRVWADLNKDGINMSPEVALGRLPVSTIAELDAYIDKVVAYECYPLPKHIARTAMVIAGTFPGAEATSNTIVSMLKTSGFSTTEWYPNNWSPLAANERRAMVCGRINKQDCALVTYVGDGAPDRFDHDILHAADATRLRGRHTRPIFFAAACDTAQFHAAGTYLDVNGKTWTDPQGVAPNKLARPEPAAIQPPARDRDSFAEQMLNAEDAGAMVYIGGYTGLQAYSHALLKHFVLAVAAPSDEITAGMAWRVALNMYIATNVIPLIPANLDGGWHDFANYHHIHKVMFFGDPSLRLSWRYQ